jgi:hypothetical protein
MSGIPSSMYCVALHLALRECGPQDYLAIKSAIEQPGPETVRAVLDAGHGKPWRVRIEHALIEIGIAASASVECPK